MGATRDLETMLFDPFIGPLSALKWRANIDDGSFHDGSQAHPALPTTVTGDVLNMTFSTYNPTNDPRFPPAFLANEIISQPPLFVAGSGGYAVEARIAYSAGAPPGSVLGFFLYAPPAFATGPHDEIDFEFLGNDKAQGLVTTNVYDNIPAGLGFPEETAVAGLHDFHVYRIEVIGGLAVRWLIDGQVVRETTANVPDGPMAVHINAYGIRADSPFTAARSETLNPSLTGPGVTYTLGAVDYVRVTSLAAAAGTPGADILAAPSAQGGNYIAGGGGDDGLSGASAGSDSIYGGDGADTLRGGDGGANYLRGDAGGDSIMGGAGFDDINGNMGNDTCVSGGGDDWVVGGKDNDSLMGSAGANLVYGNLGDDTCDGGAGADTVRGGQANDSLSGSAGADFLSGDLGSDTMVGGSGADVFHSFTGAGGDRVLDFSLADGDRVQLDPGNTFTVAQVGADTVITLGPGDSVILVGVQMSTLTPGWIFGS